MEKDRGVVVEDFSLKKHFHNEALRSRIIVTKGNFAIKDFSEEESKVYLSNYLEAICRTDIENILLITGTIALVEFKETLKDLSLCSMKALEKKLNGAAVSLSQLGEAAGVFIPNFPHEITKEYTKLYFENIRSCGVEDTVEKVVLDNIGSRTVAAVYINDKNAITSIVSKTDHIAYKKPITVEPLYPVIHHDFVQFLKSHSGNGIQDTISTGYMKAKPGVHSSSHKQSTNLPGAAPTLTAATKTTHNRSENNTGITFSDKYAFNSDNFKTANSVIAKSLSPNVMQHSCLRLHNSLADGDLTNVNGIVTPNVAEIKPFYTNNDSHSSVSSSLQAGKVKIDQTMKLTPPKVALLKQSEFVNAYQISFDETKGSLVIHTSSGEQLRKIKLQIYEYLFNIHEESKQLTVGEYEFRSRPACRIYLQEQCSLKMLKVTYEIKDNKLICVGLSHTDAKKGLEFAIGIVTVLEVQLRSGQEELIRGEKWAQFKSTIKHELATVCTPPVSDDTKLVIMSFIEKEAQTMRRKVIQFLRTSTPQHTAKIELTGAKAECFKKYFQENFQDDVREKYYHPDVNTLQEKPLKLHVAVKGGDNATTLVLQNWIDKICFADVDFSKISKHDQDIWLMVKGLNREYGNEFLRHFEMTNACFIDVKKEGELQPPPTVIHAQHRDAKEEPTDQKYSKDVEPTDQKYSKDVEPTDQKYSKDVEPTDQKYSKDVEPTQYHSKQHISHQYFDDLQLALAMSLSESQIDKSRNTSSEEYPDDCSFSDDEEPASHHLKQNIFKDEADDSDVLIEQNRRKSEMEEPFNAYFSLGEDNSDIGVDDMAEYPSYHSLTLRSTQKEFDKQPTKHYSVSSRDKYEIDIFNTIVSVVKGNIVKERADALVNILSVSRNLESQIAKSFVRAGGRQFVQMFNERKEATERGSPIITEANGCLPCILHVALNNGLQDCKKNILSTMQSILAICTQNTFTSVAIPPLGVGRMYKYPVQIVADTMLQTIHDYLLSHQSQLKKIIFVIYDEDYDTCTTFRSALKNYADNADSFRLSKGNRKIMVQKHNSRSTVNKRRDFSAKHETNKHGINQNDDYVRRKDYHKHDKNRYKQTLILTSDLELNSDKSKGQRKQKEMRASRFPAETSISKIKVTVFAECKSRCVELRNALGKEIRQQFVYEEQVDKRQKISEDAKKKIIGILENYDIKSVKGKDIYVLRGYKVNVEKAHKEILKLLLYEKDEHAKNQKRKEDVKRETHEYVALMVKLEPEVPTYWKNFHPGEFITNVIGTVKKLIGDKEFLREKLKEDSHCYQTILKMINKTFDEKNLGKGQDAVGLAELKYSKIHVTKIERIENIDLYRSYALQRTSFFRKLQKTQRNRFLSVGDLPKSSGDIVLNKYTNATINQDLNQEINECYLFHGTKRDTVKAICTQGLDQRMCSDKAMFGSGIYGAESVMKADQYTDDKQQRTGGEGQTKKMFLIRMILGDCYLCTDQNPHKFRRPPCRKCKKDNCTHSQMYDSVVGDNNKLFREFVVYDKNQCYPEYLITYERR